MRLRLAGEGEAGEKGAPSGDMYIEVNVQEDGRFKRNGDMLFTTVHISFPQAALGSDIKISTMNGSEHIKIPSGTQNGKTFTLKGKGMPRLRGGHGNLIVKVIVDVPEKLSTKERDIIMELADEMDVTTKESLGTKLFGRGT